MAKNAGQPDRSLKKAGTGTLNADAATWIPMCLVFRVLGYGVSRLSLGVQESALAK